MKKIYALGLVLLMAAVMSLPARAAMWVGAEIGSNFPLDSIYSVNGHYKSTTSFYPATVIGGVTVGYDFINSGFLAHNWPEWMKYFSVATDFTYNRLNVASETEGLGQFIASGGKVDGYEAVWTFLFMAHYGFFPDADVPTGRVQPYIGVGPAILFSGLNLSQFRSSSPVFFRNNLGSTSSTDVALVVEPGIRWMALQNVSIDTSVRYRYAQPSYNINGVTIKSNGLNQLAILVRANYHF